MPYQWKPSLATFPANGAVVKFPPFYESDHHGGFVISAIGLNPTSSYQVRIIDRRSGETVSTVLLPGGKVVSTSLPLGSYGAIVSTGPEWYGVEKGFWWFGQSTEGAQPISIYESADGQTVGKRLNLARWLAEARK